MKGDIVLIPFPFTDLTGNKLRPALVLVQNSNDLTVAFITTQLHWQEPTDMVLKPSAANGIKKISIVRLTKIATIDSTLVLGKIGLLTNAEIIEVNSKLKTIFLIP